MRIDVIEKLIDMCPQGAEIRSIRQEKDDLIVNFDLSESVLKRAEEARLLAEIQELLDNI